MRLQSPDPYLVAIPRQTQDFLFSSGKVPARVGFLHRRKAALTPEPRERAWGAAAAVPSPRLQRPHPAAVAPSLRAWLRPGRGPPPHSGRRELGGGGLVAGRLGPGEEPAALPARAAAIKPRRWRAVGSASGAQRREVEAIPASQASWGATAGPEPRFPRPTTALPVHLRELAAGWFAAGCAGPCAPAGEAWHCLGCGPGGKGAGRARWAAPTAQPRRGGKRGRPAAHLSQG